VAWQQVYGIALALLIRLLHLRPQIKICILSFIVAPTKQHGFFRYVIDYALHSSCVKSIVCYNEAEMALYKQIFPGVAHKFSAATLSEDIENIQNYQIMDEGYYVAAGRSNRDNDFLIEYFSKHPDKKLHLITDQTNGTKLPDNVLLLDKTFGHDYLQQIAGCTAVVMAFKDDTMSAGQLVFLHALQFGKPVVATRSKCLSGYILDGVNGLEIDKDESALDIALNRLNVTDYYKSISSNALSDYKQRFGFTQLAKRVVEIVTAK
jgi:glycosyltransferase involved in cell wall biosynthesis